MATRQLDILRGHWEFEEASLLELRPEFVAKEVRHLFSKIPIHHKQILKPSMPLIRVLEFVTRSKERSYFVHSPHVPQILPHRLSFVPTGEESYFNPWACPLHGPRTAM